MAEELQFVVDLGVAVAAGLVAGSAARLLGLPAVVGYLLAGIIIGPFTPGFEADTERIALLGEIGVILLLFALGVEFSIRELLAVRRVAVGAGVLQIAIIAATGAVAMVVLGLEPKAALVVGAVVSISSTLVVIKTLTERGELDAVHGKAAIGWMIVQDIATIAFIVALPALTSGDLVGPLALAVGKAALFLVLAYFVGTRLLPRIFEAVAHLGSPELFLLAVFATALLAAAFSNIVFGLSLALGAFVAGLLVSESDLSYQAAAEVIPFRDLFAVLFFISVGMLVDPAALVSEIPLLVVLVVIAVVGKAIVSGALSHLFGLPLRSAVLLAAVIAQVGEFSLILASDALELELIDLAVYNLLLGTAVLSILVGPLVLRLTDAGMDRWLTRMAAAPIPVAGGAAAAGAVAALPVPSLVEPPRAGHEPTIRGERQLVGTGSERRAVVVVGAGRVGRVVIAAARKRGFPCVAIDRDRVRLHEADELGAATLYGDAVRPEILARARLDHASVLVIAVGDRLTARLVAERARAAYPRLPIASRVRGTKQASELRDVGVDRLADPDAEVAIELARHALGRMGVSSQELASVVVGLRRDLYGR
jgi:CPA2 family monovalent cation:H+ antiporter-2